MATPIPSPILVTPQFTYPQCLTCTTNDRVVVLTSDPVSHVIECHPEARVAVEAQFAPRHQKIVRTAR